MRRLFFIAVLSICQFSRADLKTVFYENESKVCLQGTLEKHSFDFSDSTQNISIQFKLKLDHPVGLHQIYGGQNFYSSSDKVVLTSTTALAKDLQKQLDKKETIRLCGLIRYPEVSPEGQDAPVLDLR